VNEVPNGSNFLRFAGLSISGGGILNLNDNDFILDYSGDSPIDSIRGLIASGYNGGAWNGTTGILTSLGTSAKGIGYAEAAGVLGAGGGIFDGQSVDATTILGKFTYTGDASLDGQVDVSDLGRLATGWQTSQNWEGGDFNYDHFADVSDLGILATNWQLGVGAPLSRPAEPSQQPIVAAPSAASTQMVHRRSLIELLDNSGVGET